MLLQELFLEQLLVYSGYSFVFAKTAKGLGLCKAIFGCATLLPAMPWPYIDVMLIAVPISAIFTLVVSLLTKPPAQEIIDKAFEDIDNKGSGGTMMVLGIEDPWIWGVYVLIILSTLLCIIYGIVYWNRDY